MIQAPYHLYHFSPSTLEMLLTENGFEVYHTIQSPGINGIALSIKNLWQSKHKVSINKTINSDNLTSVLSDFQQRAVIQLKRKIAIPLLKQVCKLLAVIGHGDVFTMYARKQ